jgi:DNA-binding NarL/FixJ family response regulator
MIDHYPAIKILALSTMESEMAIIRMIKNGARGYLLKDADPSELKLAFDELFSIGYYYNEMVSRKLLRSIDLIADTKNQTSTLGRLTERELDFLQLVCSEKTYKQIAQEMFLS